MAPKDRDLLYIVHMLERIALIETLLAKGMQQLQSDQVCWLALLRALQEVGESSKRISEEVKQRSPELSWKKIAGFRDVLVHDYLGLDPNTVIDIAKDRLPELRSFLLMIKKQKEQTHD